MAGSQVRALFMWLLYTGTKLLIQILNKPSVTDLLFHAVLCELSVVGQGRHQLILGDFNVEPSKIPCLVEGISEGSGLPICFCCLHWEMG